ncbi:hypothetical protein MRB53_007799 [Persea americana]|uniref:Uncharacterized protein n=1 Tax=Persea americana TaxID=3435 RepID=A0ACC2MKC2_PERAE|nr:hypothetical protein MRB53_007799 [Persea americana]
MTWYNLPVRSIRVKIQPTNANFANPLRSQRVELEATGLMMHCADGRGVVADQGTQVKCLACSREMRWAPRVYFVGETAVNLEAEVEGGKKIKCNICAKKGAALGCFAKSCHRSFHVPCAAESLDLHSSLKLPKGRSKSGKKKRANRGFVDDLDAKPGADNDNASSSMSSLNWES